MKAPQVMFALVWKDMMSEFRSKQFIFSSLSFGVLLMFITGIALNSDGRLSPDYASGVLWLSLFFSTAISMNRHDVTERELGGMYGLLLAPVDRSVIFYAKWISTTLFVFISELGLIFAFFIILNQPIPPLLPEFFLVFTCGSIGMTGVGTFLATLLTQSTMKDILLPLLLFPVCIPLFLAVVRLTVWTFTGTADGVDVWIQVMCGYIVAFIVLPWLLFETLMEV